MEKYYEDLSLEKLIVAVLEKVRQMYKYTNEYKEILSVNPEIKVSINEKSVSLSSLNFSYYDIVLVTKNKIIFSPERGEDKILIEYKNFEELLKI